jgi:hypothetical protein
MGVEKFYSISKERKARAGIFQVSVSQVRCFFDWQDPLGGLYREIPWMARKQPSPLKRQT